jgi:hypothetical protein
MAVPMLRRFSIVAPGALNTDVVATDDETALAFFNPGTNVILDLVSDPQPAAGINHTVALWKNGTDTGRRFYSTGLNPASAGRVAVGPIPLTPGNYQLRIRQTLGALTAYNCVFKFSAKF